MCTEAAGMTFLLCEINNEGDYRHLNGDTQMRQNPGRLLEGWQPTSNNGEPQTAVVKLIFYGLPSNTTRRDLTIVTTRLTIYLQNWGVPVLKICTSYHSHNIMRETTLSQEGRESEIILYIVPVDFTALKLLFCESDETLLLPKEAIMPRQQHLRRHGRGQLEVRTAICDSLSLLL